MVHFFLLFCPIYIYIYRERERERRGGRVREREKVEKGDGEREFRDRIISGYSNKERKLKDNESRTRSILFLFATINRVARVSHGSSWPMTQEWEGTFGREMEAVKENGSWLVEWTLEEDAFNDTDQIYCLQINLEPVSPNWFIFRVLTFLRG